MDSEPDRGATFTVILPRVDEEPTPEISASDVGEIPLGHETVLVVEDEPLVLKVAEQVLCDQGYNVLLAANGHEALAVGHEHAIERIHLLLTDVIMPQMGGKELAGRFLEMHPETKVLYTSGYRDDVIVERGVLNPEVSFIQKPFTPASLAQKVRRVLDRATPLASV